MKIILSRKGFDSQNGGIASPIFFFFLMISFPIPSFEWTGFKDLIHGGKTFLQMLDDLNYKQYRYGCHLDPDLDNSKRLKPVEGWFPAFGQTGASATYLKNNSVEPGDLFLFFGTFHRVEEVNGHLRYVKRTGNFYNDKDLHVIWGYLQIGEILDKWEDIKKVWWHSHAVPDRNSDAANTIFKAADTLSFDDSKPGAGLLTFDKKRVLTLEGATKGVWKKNSVYDVDHILCKRKNTAKTPDGIYYSGIWQELVLQESEACTEWAKNIIE